MKTFLLILYVLYGTETHELVVDHDLSLSDCITAIAEADYPPALECRADDSKILKTANRSH